MDRAMNPQVCLAGKLNNRVVGIEGKISCWKK